MALENPRIWTSVIEANEYPDLISRYAIDAVPKIVINDRVEMLGAQPESVFVAKVVEASGSSSPRQPERASER